MDDHKDQTIAKSVERAQPFELSDRLSNRWEKPPGVIDLRHPIQRYDRSAGLTLQRLPLLDHLSARRAEDETPRAAQEFVIGRSVADNSRPQSVASELFSARPDLSSASEMRAEKLTDTTVNNLLSGNARISRKPVQQTSKPASPPSPATSSVEGSADNWEASRNPQGVQGGESIAGQVSFSPPLKLQKKTAQASPDAQVRSSESDEGVNASARPSDRNPPEARANLNTGATMVKVMRLSDKKTIMQPAMRNEETRAAITNEPASVEGPGQAFVSQQPGSMVLRKASTSQFDDSPESRELYLQPVIQTARQEPARDLGRSGMANASASKSESNTYQGGNEGATSLPLIKRTAPAPQVQRQAKGGQAQEAVDTDGSQPSQHEQRLDASTESGSKQSAPPIAIKETRERAAAPSSLVLRKSTGRTASEQAPDLPAAPISIARQVSSPPVVQTLPEGSQTGVTLPAQTGGGVNTGKVIQEVIRVISRNLEVERERRGFERWKS